MMSFVLVACCLWASYWFGVVWVVLLLFDLDCGFDVAWYMVVMCLVACFVFGCGCA